MTERIMKIMESEDLIPSKFAEEIGIQHSTISHLLAGRNNPSLNLVTKILERFPTISTDWLLFGKGNMYGQKQVGQPSLFTEWEEQSPSTEQSKPHLPIDTEKALENAQIFSPTPIEKRSITKIMVFYSDNTYETYAAEKESK